MHYNLSRVPVVAQTMCKTFNKNRVLAETIYTKTACAQTCADCP